ncbi:MAG: hypothetical protein RIM72_00575 [Alphaproteobacteria bacterium]
MMIKLTRRAGMDGADSLARRSPSSAHRPGSETAYNLLQQGGRTLSAIEALIRARQDLESALLRIEQEISADPVSADTDDLGSRLKTAVDRIRHEQVGTIDDVSEQDAFVSRFGAHAENRIDALTARLAETQKEQATARLNTLLAGIADALSREEDGDEMDRLVQDGLNAIEAFSDTLPLNVRSNLKKTFHKNLAEAEFTRLLDDDPHKAVEALDRGAFADMDVATQDAWKKKARKAAAAHDRDVRRLKTSADRAEAVAAVKKQAALYTELRTSIETGEAGYVEINAASGETGGLSAGLRRQLRALLDEKLETDKQATDAIDRVREIIADGGDLLPDHDANLERAFDAMIGKCHPDMPLEQGRMTLTFAEQTKRLPSPCLEPLWRCVIRGPQDKAGDCAGFLRRIGEIDGLELAVPDEARSAFDAFTGLVEAGWPPRDAMRQVRSRPAA